MLEHEIYMRRCITFAQFGAGRVSPNPMVGALIVHNGKVIAENYHQRYGGAHAEVLVMGEVLEKFGERAAVVFSESTMYVSLEPCAHYGKTPPCADRIVRHGIPKVVIGCRDPFSKVNGKGVQVLTAAGVEVIEGVLESEARWLNRRFTTSLEYQRPYIILKWAQTADGYMAPLGGGQRWVTGAEAKQLVHRWRSEEDAVLVGANTALADNPALTVREWSGRNPKRVLIDKQLAVSVSAKLFDGEAETIVFNAVKLDWQGTVKHIQLENFDWYLPQNIAYQLYLMDVQSLIVEGGRKTLDLFIKAGLWDEARVFTSPDVWGVGIEAPALHSKAVCTQAVGQDRLEILYNRD